MPPKTHPTYEKCGQSQSYAPHPACEWQLKSENISRKRLRDNLKNEVTKYVGAKREPTKSGETDVVMTGQSDQQYPRCSIQICKTNGELDTVLSHAKRIHVVAQNNVYLL